MKRVQLREIAHSRSGDKGDAVNLSVIPYREEDYELVCREVTVERVRALFKDICHGEIVRYEVPNVSALNFLLENCLGGGVTKSLALDMHGKSYSFLLLSMEINVPE
ncbi:MAG: hypothetical protein OXP71_07975 [Candidatus Poribacteria bacterium]|nr:hypothetical protein [Candidatus Poribacteria bacterium]